jgi:hypothetical protein
VDHVHIPPLLGTRLKVFGEVNDVFNSAHKSKNVVTPNIIIRPKSMHNIMHR